MGPDSRFVARRQVKCPPPILDQLLTDIRSYSSEVLKMKHYTPNIVRSRRKAQYIESVFLDLLLIVVLQPETAKGIGTLNYGTA
jgi:hypothetical protein